MRKTGLEIYMETEKEIPLWKQKLSKVESEIANAEFYTHKYLEMSYTESIKLEKLKKRKEEILLEAKENQLWN